MKKITHISADKTKSVLLSSIKQYEDVPVIIGVAGGSCVGKTSTILCYLSELLSINATVLSVDNFQLGEDFTLKDKSKYRWDDPMNFALDEIYKVIEQLKKGKDVSIPVFNLEKNKREGTKVLKPNKYIIVEGIYAYYKELEMLIDSKIYLETPYYGRLLRRIFRFTREDKINKPEVPVKHMTGPTYRAHIDHVAKQKDNADLIITMPYSFEETYNKFKLKNIKERLSSGLSEIYFTSPEGVTLGRTGNEFVVIFKKSKLFRANLEKNILNNIRDINFIGL